MDPKRRGRKTARPRPKIYGHGVEVQPPLTEQFDPAALKHVGPLRGSFSHALLLHPGAASADWTAMSESVDRYGERTGDETAVTIWAVARTATMIRIRSVMRRIR